MQETIAFCLVLFLALYGVACLCRRICLWVLRPHNGLSAFSVAYLSEDSENVEQIIRYFRAKAGRKDVLLLIDNGMCVDDIEVITRLCKGRNDVRLLQA